MLWSKEIENHWSIQRKKVFFPYSLNSMCSIKLSKIWCWGYPFKSHWHSYFLCTMLLGHAKIPFLIEMYFPKGIDLSRVTCDVHNRKVTLQSDETWAHPQLYWKHTKTIHNLKTFFSCSSSRALKISWGRYSWVQASEHTGQRSLILL